MREIRSAFPARKPKNGWRDGTHTLWHAFVTGITFVRVYMVFQNSEIVDGPAPAQPAGGTERLTPEQFRDPAVLLSGTVDYDMYKCFREQLALAPAAGLVVIELSTLGGDPEVARMMGEDIRFHAEVDPQRRFVFLGKAAIYSAGTTFMSFFARENRYLTRGTRLMIHERKMAKTMQVDGPLTTCIAALKATLHEIECSIEIQNEGFANLIVGSSVSMDEVIEKATKNWYIEAQEAQALGLVEGVL